MSEFINRGLSATASKILTVDRLEEHRGDTFAGLHHSSRTTDSMSPMSLKSPSKAKRVNVHSTLFVLLPGLGKVGVVDHAEK